MRTRAGGLLGARLLVVVAFLVLAASSPRLVRADAVVGTGTASSCTGAAFDVALAGGGRVTFNCGASPVTIAVTSQKTIAVNTGIDGGGLVALTGIGDTGVLVNATLTLVNLTIRGVVGGGAISNYGNLTVDSGTFSGNIAFGSGGGAIYNTGNLTVTKSVFSNNVAGYPYEGGAIYNNLGTMKVTNSTFTGSSDSSGSAAIYNYTYTTVYVSVIDSTFTGNTGGAISNRQGPLIVTNSTFSDNSSAISNNRAGTATVTNCTFSGNNGAISNGSALYPTGETLTVTNSTFFRNILAGSGSGGGAISNSGTGMVNVINSSFTRNRAGYGGAIINVSARAVTLINTIVANNTSSTSGGNCFGTLSDGGHNPQFGDSTCGGTITIADPKFDPAGLGKNGGPTQTIALQPGSPAIGSQPATRWSVRKAIGRFAEVA